MQFRSSLFSSTFFFFVLAAHMVASVPTPHEEMEVEPDVVDASTAVHHPEDVSLDTTKVMQEDESVAVSMDGIYPDCTLADPTALPECVVPGQLAIRTCSRWEQYAVAHCLEFDCPAGAMYEECMTRLEYSVLQMPVETLESCYSRKVTAWCWGTQTEPVDAGMEPLETIEEEPVGSEPELVPEAVEEVPHSPESMNPETIHNHHEGEHGGAEGGLPLGLPIPLVM